MTDGANEQTAVLVFKSQAGDYYLVPQEMLERGRVAEEHKAEVERLISELRDDVRGHVAGEAVCLIAVFAVAYGYMAYNSSQSTGDWLQQAKQIYDKYN